MKSVECKTSPPFLHSVPPSPELVERVRDLYHKRVPDVRFLIPVINGLEKVTCVLGILPTLNNRNSFILITLFVFLMQNEVIQALPKLIKLNPIVVKEVFNRLLGTQHSKSLSVCQWWTSRCPPFLLFLTLRTAQTFSHFITLYILNITFFYQRIHFTRFLCFYFNRQDLLAASVEYSFRWRTRTSSHCCVLSFRWGKFHCVPSDPRRPADRLTQHRLDQMWYEVYHKRSAFRD